VKLFLARMRLLVARCAVAVIYLDFRMLMLVERLSHRVQWWTGYDCFHLRNGLFRFMAACFTVQMWLDFHGPMLPWLAFVWAPVAGNFLVLSFARRASDDMLREGKVLNILKVDLFSCLSRPLLAVLLLPIAFMRWAPCNAGLIAMVISWYLSACNPLPPGQGKIGKWVRSLVARPLPSPVPQH